MQPAIRLSAGWAGQAQWRIIETDFRLGQDFLTTWEAWRADPQRPRLLHFVSFCAQAPDPETLGRRGASLPAPSTCIDALRAQWWGMVPGVHRLVFEGGRVLLTIGVGDVWHLLREQELVADDVLLEGLDPRPLDAPALKALVHCCRPGTTATVRHASAELQRALQRSGFAFDAAPQEGTAAARAVFSPHWTPRRQVPAPLAPSSAVVIGAGMAGASVAASLARRGWQVEVLDAAPLPAAGASALPAGLLAPHTTPDDNLLSRLTRSGVRLTLQQAAALLDAGTDWQRTGVLERRGADARALPEIGPGQEAWQRSDRHVEHAIWHAAGGWIRPAALVRAWLAQPGVRFRGSTPVHRMSREAGLWCLFDAHGVELAQAPLIVVAAAYGSASLLEDRILLNPVRGQVSWGSMEGGMDLPAFPVNGNGHFLPGVPTADGPVWLIGSTYVRGDTSLALRPVEDAANLERLRALLPHVAEQVAPAFAAGQVRAWAGVRCTAADRRPLVGELEPGLWISTAMGSRGLTFAALCAELLAARLHGEPLPLDGRLARALSVERLPRPSVRAGAPGHGQAERSS